MIVRDLVTEIESDTEASSFCRDRVNHVRFKEITAMGMSAVPELIALLDSNPEMLVASLALCAIVGEPTIPKEHRGKIKVITEYWKQWYKNNLTSVEPDTTKIQVVQKDGFSVGGAG